MGIFDDSIEKALLDNSKNTKKDWAQIESDDDDQGTSGGGGPKKSLLGFFKREKLFNLIQEGKLKASHFQTFLSKESLDKSELEKSVLEKEVELDTAEKQKERTHETKKVGHEDSTLKTVSASTPLNFLARNNSLNTLPPLVQAQEMGNKAILGGKLQGLNYGLHHGDSLGSIRQSWMVGDRKEASQTSSNKPINFLGDTVSNKGPAAKESETKTNNKPEEIAKNTTTRR